MKRTQCAGMILLATLLMTTGCSEWISKRALERGLAAMHQGDYATAAKQLEKASHHIVDNASLYYNLGTAYYGLGQIDNALKAFQTALELTPNDREVMQFIGKIHLQRQEWDLAGAMFEKAGLGQPPDAHLLAYLAEAANGAGRTDAARIYLIRALNADRTFAAAYYDLGAMYAEKYMLPAEAVDCYEVFVHMADQKDPHVEKAKAGIVRLQQVLSRLPQPLPPGAKRDPAAGLKFVADGDKQRAAKQMVKAEKAYRDALVADPLCHDAAYNLAQILKSKNNLPDALKMLVRASAIEPVRQTTLLDCAQTAITLKQYRDAACMLDRVIARWPNSAPAYAFMALVRQADGHAADARVYVDQYVRLAPPGPERDRYEAWAKTLPQ